MKFDDVFDHVGEMGVYQWLSTVLISLYGLLGSDAISVVFTAGFMPHWCDIEELKDIPFNQQKYIGIPEISPGVYSGCEKYDLNYSLYTLEDFMTWNRSMNLPNDTVTSTCDTWVYDRSRFLSTAVSKYDLVCSDSHLVALISTMLMVGILIASLMAGPLADRYGRKPVMFIFSMMKVVAHFVTAFSPNYLVFAGSRLFLGIGSYSSYLASYILLMEEVGPAYRIWCTVVLDMAISAGMMLVTAMGYAVRAFTPLCLCLAVPTTIFISFWFVIPESPRWLLVHGKYTEADTVIRHMAAVNNRELPRDFDVTKVEADDQKMVAQGTILDIFRSPRMRKVSLIIDFYWFTVVLIYYALSLNIGDLYGDVYVNMIIGAIVDIASALVCIPLLNWHVTGRRRTCSFSMVTACVSSFIRIGFMANGMKVGDMIMSMVGRGFVNIGFAAIYVYSAEVFPTEVRTTAFGVASCFGRVGGMAASYVGGPLARVWLPLPVVIFAVISLASGLSISYLPETLGHDMLDTIEEAEQFFTKNTTHKAEHSVKNQTNDDAIRTMDDVTTLKL